MKCDRKMMTLYGVTDRAWVGTLTLAQQVEAALKGGVTCLQLREKELSQPELMEEACEIQGLCRAYGVPFLINDDVDAAVACDADGVHIGQEDMDAAEARRRIGADKILGVSAQTVEQAQEAEKKGADYLGVGAVFPTATKPDAAEVSLETLQDICRAVKIPVVAIGGIGVDNIQSLRKTGVDGVALVSAIFGAEDIERRCIELKKLVENW